MQHKNRCKCALIGAASRQKNRPFVNDAAATHRSRDKPSSEFDALLTQHNFAVAALVSSCNVVQRHSGHSNGLQIALTRPTLGSGCSPTLRRLASSNRAQKGKRISWQTVRRSHPLSAPLTQWGRGPKKWSSHHHHVEDEHKM